MRKELVKKLKKQGERPAELKKRYKEQIQRIKDSFPKESANRILKDLNYEDFLKDTLKKKLLKDKRSEDKEG